MPPIILPAGEQTKSYEQVQSVVEQLLAQKIERADLVIALGGGVIGDLAGFAASILRRGVDFIQIPTSLLAQVDSSVGGKTGINSPHGKNLIGAFHQPLLVLCDTDVLATLPPRQFRAGYAEVVKYGLIRDKAFFEWLGTNRAAIFNLETEALTEAIRFSCAMKARVVAEDEKEHGVRALLNLGHTFGHAFESLTGYGERLLHGEAISIGMVLAFAFSEKLGYCASGRALIVKEHFVATGLPTKIADIPDHLEFSLEAIVEKMSQDKKVERGTLVFILANEIGDAFVSRDVSPIDLKSFLETQI
jgi:3-dehydroquinate synthase